MTTKYLGTVEVHRLLTEEEIAERRSNLEALYLQKKLIETGRLRKRLMIKQKLTGILMLAMSALIIAMAAQGDPSNPLDTDATAILLTIPFGLYLLFSRRINICATDRDFRRLNKLEELYYNAQQNLY